MVVTALFELSLSLMSFYIIYRTSEWVTNLIYFFTGLSCFAMAMAYMSGAPATPQYALIMEHHLIQAAIVLRFVSIWRVRAANLYHHHI